MGKEWKPHCLMFLSWEVDFEMGLGSYLLYCSVGRDCYAVRLGLMIARTWKVDI